MRRADHNRGIASHRVRSLLVSTLNAAALLLASAVSGAAIALHLAAAPPIGEHRPLRGGAATPAPVAAAVSIEEPKIVIAEPASTAQASAEAAPAIASDASATKLAAWMPTRAAPPDAERQLTFAWGYAQRHPEALSQIPQEL